MGETVKPGHGEQRVRRSAFKGALVRWGRLKAERQTLEATTQGGFAFDSAGIPPRGMSVKRETEDQKPLLNRVRRIAGQVDGIGRMIEENRECPEVLNTIAAVHSALRGLETKLLEDHVP